MVDHSIGENLYVYDFHWIDDLNDWMLVSKLKFGEDVVEKRKIRSPDVEHELWMKYLLIF